MFSAEDVECAILAALARCPAAGLSSSALGELVVPGTVLDIRTVLKSISVAGRIPPELSTTKAFLGDMETRGLIQLQVLKGSWVSSVPLDGDRESNSPRSRVRTGVDSGEPAALSQNAQAEPHDQQLLPPGEARLSAWTVAFGLNLVCADFAHAQSWLSCGSTWRHFSSWQRKA